MADLLTGPYDAADCSMEIEAGAGGTEPQDWASILLRAYLHWAERHGIAATMVDQMPGEVVGVKKVTVEFRGHAVYGRLKGERGIHRLTRISPWDAQKRRHTSFVKVDVIVETAERTIGELAGDPAWHEWEIIRSYVLDHPGVKDHRTQHETGNVAAVLDGEIDPFIHAYLTQFRSDGRA
jgi:protein subunit release factor B